MNFKKQRENFIKSIHLYFTVIHRDNFYFSDYMGGYVGI